jgi:hypothetical protein
VQAGVDSAPSGGGNQSNRAFWEVFPGTNGEQQWSYASILAGDHIHVYISSNNGNDGYDYFLVQDLTRNHYNDNTNYSSSYFSDSATGECILERPINGSTGNPYLLPNFGTEHLSACDISGPGAYQGVGLWPHKYYSMTSDGTSSGKLLAYPDNTTSNNGLDFSVYWVVAS